MGLQEKGLRDSEAGWVHHLKEIVIEVAAEQTGLMRGDLDPDATPVPRVDLSTA